MRVYGTRLVWNSVHRRRGTIEAEGGREGGDDLVGQTAVEVDVRRALNVQATTADVVEGLVVEQCGDVGVLEEGVGGERRVVRLG